MTLAVIPVPVATAIVPDAHLQYLELITTPILVALLVGGGDCCVSTSCLSPPPLPRTSHPPLPPCVLCQVVCVHTLKHISGTQRHVCLVHRF
jgi:hypothetical protein